MKYRREPYQHQVIGIEWLRDLVRPEEGRVFPGGLLLADDMRLGKTKQTIDAAQHLFEEGDIDQVIVVAPGPVRDVWYDMEIGELQKHLWEGTPSVVYEYHKVPRFWKWCCDADTERALRWIITNYEYMRYKVQRTHRWTGPHLDPLLDIAKTRRTVLVLDESSNIKTHNSLQSRACLALRRKCERVWELNGTPVDHSPLDMYAQAFMMDHRILDCKTVHAFKARYAIMGGYRRQLTDRELKSGKTERVATQIVGWKNMDDFKRRLKPYVLRRIRTECLDLPPKLDPVTLTATLTSRTWKHYLELTEELLTWINANTASAATIAPVKAMRLAQITSGFAAGLLENAPCPECSGTGTGYDGDACLACAGLGTVLMKSDAPPLEIGTEKAELLESWIAQRLQEEPEMRMLVWCRFRPELHRTVERLEAKFPGVKLAAMHGDQKREHRGEALRLMHPDSVYDGPAVLVGTLGTGSVGLNLAGAHEVVYLSNDRRLFNRMQSEDRPHGPGQTHPVSYHDICAVGPKGQRTIDHHVVKSLRQKRDLADWTVQDWVEALKGVL